MQGLISSISWSIVDITATAVAFVMAISTLHFDTALFILNPPQDTPGQQTEVKDSIELPVAQAPQIPIVKSAEDKISEPVFPPVDQIYVFSATIVEKKEDPSEDTELYEVDIRRSYKGDLQGRTRILVNRGFRFGKVGTGHPYAAVYDKEYDAYDTRSLSSLVSFNGVVVEKLEEDEGKLGQRYKIKITYSELISQPVSGTLLMNNQLGQELEIGKQYAFYAVRKPRTSQYEILHARYPAPIYD